MGATIHTIPLGIDNVYVVKDKGVVIILDRRVQEQRYGDDFLESLPETTLTYGSLQDVAGNVKDWLA